MYDELKKYNQKQILFATEYLSSGSIKEACKKINITQQTANNWLKSGLEDDLDLIKNKIINNTLEQLKMLLAKSKDTIEHILEDENVPYNIKLNAAKLVIDNFIKQREQTEIINKLEELEKHYLER